MRAPTSYTAGRDNRCWKEVRSGLLFRTAKVKATLNAGAGIVEPFPSGRWHLRNIFVPTAQIADQPNGVLKGRKG